jgi:hypothetical protein
MTLCDWQLVSWYAKGVTLALLYLAEALLVKAPPAMQSAFLCLLDAGQFVLPL